ncbi:permease [Vibrio sp. PID23_8]|uniref:permease n=1 Tax=Vibrio sp. PID23_8 TaxID=1583767 RepID=UPI000E689D60|nr:permease [Vibrio sp. PID23_8]RIZ52650.1 permease [Vibrio sp. PID23_8]
MLGLQVRVQDSLVVGIINGLINGYIAYMHFEPMGVVPVSINLVRHEQITVWGEAITLTFGLGIILSLITSKLFLCHLGKAYPEALPQMASSFWADLVPIALKHSAALFGWLTVLALLWTQYIGKVMVSAYIAAVMVGMFAFFITLILEVRTKNSLLYKKVSVIELIEEHKAPN